LLKNYLVQQKLFYYFTAKMENPFEIILEKLNSTEKAIEKLNTSPNNGFDTLLSRAEINNPLFIGVNRFLGANNVRSKTK
jgi:hypothetical protein